MSEYDWLIVALREYAEKQREQLVYEAADAIEELSKPQNTVHLCTSCKYQYPECPADTGVVFGRGKGNDNICQCADYVARIPRWIPVTEQNHPKEYEPVMVVYIGWNDALPHRDCTAYWSENEEVWRWEETNEKVTVPITHYMSLPPLPEPPKEEKT